MNSEELSFTWELQPDLLLIGNRLHRYNAEKRCLFDLGGGDLCQEIENREHLFIFCFRIQDCFDACRKLVEDYLGKNLNSKEILYIAFNHRNKKRLKCALWFVIKILYKIYQNRSINNSQ